MKFIYVFIPLFLYNLSSYAQDDLLIDDPIVKSNIINLIEKELGTIPNLRSNLTIKSQPSNIQQITGVKELYFANWSHDIFVKGQLVMTVESQGQGNSLKDSYSKSTKELSLSNQSIQTLKENKNKYFAELPSTEDECRTQLLFAQKAANGNDFNKAFSIIAEFSNSPSKQCQSDAYETLNSIFDTHSEYLCSKSFTHVEVEIAKGNYQQALDYLDSGEMIPPCHLLYKTEILALIDLAVNTQLADQQLKASLQKQVKGLSDITLGQTFSFFHQWYKNYKKLP